MSKESGPNVGSEVADASQREFLFSVFLFLNNNSFINLLLQQSDFIILSFILKLQLQSVSQLKV